MTMQSKRRASRGVPARAIGVVGGLALVATLIGSTNAYFSGETAPAASAWDAGEVTVTDDTVGTAVFTAANIAPGYTETNTVTVTNTSSIEDPNQVEVRLYAEGVTGDLAPELNVQVDFVEGVAPPVTIYDGPLSGLGTTWATAATANEPDGWTSAGGTATAPTADYTFTVDFEDDGTDQSTLELAAADATFVWEARSTGVDDS